MPVRVVRKVLRRMRKIQALKLVPGWKESKARRALENVSCTRSSASASLRHEPEGVVVERGEQWESELFEGCAAMVRTAWCEVPRASEVTGP